MEIVQLWTAYQFKLVFKLLKDRFTIFFKSVLEQ